MLTAAITDCRHWQYSAVDAEKDPFWVFFFFREFFVDQ